MAQSAPRYRWHDAISKARAALAQSDAQPTRERLRDSAIVDWLECRAMNGQVQIARSMLRTGYEIAVIEPQSNKVRVYNGTLRQAIESFVRGEGAV